MATAARVRMEPTTVLNVRLTAEERAMLRAYAVANDLRLSQCLRRFIRANAPQTGETA